MYNFPIGVMVESFRTDTKTAIETAAKIGAQGLQMYGTRPGKTPEDLVGEKRKELLDIVKSNGLCFSAICGDFGEGFWRPERNPILIEKSKKVVEMALDLGTNIVTTHIGVVPEDKNHERYKIMQEACFELSRFADSMGAHFAIETGPEKSITLKGFLDSLGSKGVAVNMDPANLAMVVGDDSAEAVYNLKDYIVHTHAKDGKMIYYKNPEVLYGVTTEEELLEDDSCIEVPLGQGSVDFDKYLKALEEIGYKGYLTIEREVGETPLKDITEALDFLKKKING